MKKEEIIDFLRPFGIHRHNLDRDMRPWIFDMGLNFLIKIYPKENGEDIWHILHKKKGFPNDFNKSDRGFTNLKAAITKLYKDHKMEKEKDKAWVIPYEEMELNLNQQKKPKGKPKEKKKPKEKPKEKKDGPPPRQKLLEKFYDDLGFMQKTIEDLGDQTDFKAIELAMIKETIGTLERMAATFKEWLPMIDADEPAKEEEEKDPSDEQQTANLFKDIFIRLKKLESRQEIDPKDLEMKILDGLIITMKKNKETKE